MSLFISSLNSGSNGNCYFIGNGRDAILIDAGLSCLETEKRLRRLGLSLSMVRGIFISHEHGDHISGVEGITSKHSIPVYVTAGTLHKSRLRIKASLIHTFRPHEVVTIGGLHITAFPKLHDAADPHSFIVEGDGIHAGIFTDIGRACDNVSRYFSLCHAAFLETNYDADMLERGAYPIHLKKRISGGNGHLSNREAFELFKAYGSPSLSHLLLSHLSENNNTPELAMEAFSDTGRDVLVTVASRHGESPLYEILPESASRRITPTAAIQATLF